MFLQDITEPVHNATIHNATYSVTADGHHVHVHVGCMGITADNSASQMQRLCCHYHADETNVSNPDYRDPWCSRGGGGAWGP